MELGGPAGERDEALEEGAPEGGWEGVVEVELQGVGEAEGVVRRACQPVEEAAGPLVAAPALHECAGRPVEEVRVVARRGGEAGGHRVEVGEAGGRVSADPEVVAPDRTRGAGRGGEVVTVDERGEGREGHGHPGLGPREEPRLGVGPEIEGIPARGLRLEGRQIPRAAERVGERLEPRLGARVPFDAPHLAAIAIEDDRRRQVNDAKTRRHLGAMGRLEVDPHPEGPPSDGVDGTGLEDLRRELVAWAAPVRPDLDDGPPGLIQRGEVRVVEAVLPTAVLTEAVAVVARAFVGKASPRRVRHARARAAACGKRQRHDARPMESRDQHALPPSHLPTTAPPPDSPVPSPRRGAPRRRAARGAAGQGSLRLAHAALFNGRPVGYPAEMPRPPMGLLRTVDPFTLAILGAAVLAALAPPSEPVADTLKPFTAIGVALVFFLHGARLSPSDVVRGLRQPRLHIATALITYAAFPLVALALSPLLRLAVGPALADGFVFLAALPSTVQSSVAFVAIAGGHVAAAVAAASLSNLLGVIGTPVILSITLATPAGGGDVPLGAAVGKLGLIILAPFAVGQLAGRFLRPFLVARRGLVGLVDRAVIAVLVYEAVGQSVVAGVWSSVGADSLVLVGVFALVLLAIVTALASGIARALRLPREDAIVLVYCGSKKSMASGLPMLRVLHGDSPAAGTLALPIILFHQLQLMVFSQIAARARHRAEASQAAPPA